MSETKKIPTANVVIRKVDQYQLEKAYADNKLKRTLASVCCFSVNTYIMYIFKAAEGVSSESQLFFHLLALVMIVLSIKKQDASYIFTAFAVFFMPYIVLAAGLSPYSLLAVVSAIVVLGFQRGVTINDLSRGAMNLAENLGQSNIRRKILKLSESDISPELLLEEDLKEFTEVEAELAKVKKTYDKSSPAMKKALDRTLAKVESLQKDHARVLARSAGLDAFLKEKDLARLQAEIEDFNQQMNEADDDVVRSQLEATIKMKQQRIQELNQLGTSLKRVKMQKIQMRELFNSLMDRMNTLKFTDVMTLQASTDGMVKEVDQIRSGLEDLEKGLLEAEKYSRSNSF